MTIVVTQHASYNPPVESFYVTTRLKRFSTRALIRVTLPLNNSVIIVNIEKWHRTFLFISREIPSIILQALYTERWDDYKIDKTRCYKKELPSDFAYVSQDSRYTEYHYYLS